jgi:pimeloyl-ACP methyl ester carboxylesterase
LVDTFGGIVKKLSGLLISIFLILLFSCATINKKDPYPNMETVIYGNSTAYEFINKESNKLIIYLEGSGYNSVMGIKNNNEWEFISFGYFVIQALSNKYSIIIPEKFDRQLGIDYFGDPEMIKMYTLDNLVDSYAKTINACLEAHGNSTVILIGVSEGAAVLPFVYEKIMEKGRVKGMVAIAYGGLSRYEQMKILAESELDMPNDIKTLFQNVDNYKRDVESHSDSLGNLYGLSYIWYNSFFDYSPFDRYKNINIPVLFVHGEADINVPVESTRYIQEHLSDKPFDYFYFENTDHYFSNKNAIKILKTDGVKWIYDHS